MPQRVLILSAAVGAGHLRAAQAVEQATKRLVPDAVVKNVDVLTLTNAAFRKIYGAAYLDLVNKAPHALGYFYDYMDQPPRTKRQVGDRLRRAWEILNLQPFLEYLKSEPWDVVVNTHFLPAEMIATLKRKRRFGKPQVTVTTDFETHRLWVNEPTDLYTTATEEGKRNLESWGIKPERIAVTGIPIDPVFSDEKDRGAVLRKHGIKGDRPVVLQLAGGFGVGPIEKIYTAIQEVNRPLDIVIVCGKNARAKERVEQVSCVPRHRCKTLGFTTEMDELMCAADVVVSKPGGLTTSEALARGCAMMIVNPIPGQESRNSDFLLENGAAQKANSLSVLGYKLSRLLETSGRLEALKANARALARPGAAREVARRAVALISS
jgi:processive 1,2-diacylglycerol beta-glucosyltransferase